MNIFPTFLQEFFLVLSKFEKRKHLFDQLISTMNKNVYYKFISIGVLFLLVHARFSSTIIPSGFLSFFFKGEYSDFTREWFERVGVLIIVSMFWNMFSDPLTQLVFSFYRRIKLAWDRRAWRPKDDDVSNTRSVLEFDFVRLTYGPKFQIASRYAMIVVTRQIAMIYGSGNCLIRSQVQVT